MKSFWNALYVKASSKVSFCQILHGWTTLTKTHSLLICVFYFLPCSTPLPLHCIMSFLNQQIQQLSISLNHSSLISVIIRYWLLQEAKSWWYVRRQLTKHLLSTLLSEEPHEFNMRYWKSSLRAPDRVWLRGIAGDCRSVADMVLCCVKMGCGGRKWFQSFWRVPVPVVDRCMCISKQVIYLAWQQ